MTWCFFDEEFALLHLQKKHLKKVKMKLGGIGYLGTLGFQVDHYCKKWNLDLSVLVGI